MPGKAGRPVGSSPYKEQDDVLLGKAAKLLVRGEVRSVAAAFREVLGEENTSDPRRLQRRWASDGERFLEEARAPFQWSHWERDARALKEASPELYARLERMFGSEGGVRLLKMKGDGERPVHFMSLGIVALNELLKRYEMQGAEAAYAEFSRVYAEWSRYGSKPDPVFLRAFAARCEELADQEDGGR
jgi:hypothetical protein